MHMNSLYSYDDITWYHMISHDDTLMQMNQQYNNIQIHLITLFFIVIEHANPH